MVRSLKRRLAQVAQLEIVLEEDVEVQVEVVEEHHITTLLNGAARRGICHQNQGQCLNKGVVHDCKVLGLVQDEKHTGWFFHLPPPP